MRKITFNDDLKESLKELRTKLGPGMSKEMMANSLGTDGCGGVCKFTCSYWCSPTGPGQTADRIFPEPQN